MANTLPPEKWGLTESADWWSAGQARRQQIYGAATEMLLEVAIAQPGSRVLDVAAGTGDQTLMAARRVGPTGNVLATDDSASMLKVAAEAARNEGLTNVETRVMNAENLALDADSFDAVICRNALMLFSNPAKALTEMRRVVKLARKVAVIVFSAVEKNPLSWNSLRQLFTASETYPLQRQENPGCTHSALPGQCLKDSTAEAGFQNVSVPCRIDTSRCFPPQPKAVGNMRKGAGDLKEL